MSQNNKMTPESGILTLEQEELLLQPIQDHMDALQSRIDALRKDGSAKVTDLSNIITLIREDKNFGKEERNHQIAILNKELEKAKEVESANKSEIDKLVAEGEVYLKEHFNRDYYKLVEENCKRAKEDAKKQYERQLADHKAKHEQDLAALRKEGDGEEQKKALKELNFVYRNKTFDAKMSYHVALQDIKDRRHEAFMQQYQMIDRLRASRFTMGQTYAQKWENYRYRFNTKQFLLKNGLYLVIILIFIALSIITPIIKNTDLFTYTNVVNILQQASPRIFLGLGVAGLILLTGTDLSIGRMVGMGMVISTIVMHKGINTGQFFGIVFDLTALPIWVRILLALFLCIIFCTLFTAIAGFFTARFKIHPFITTMSNMLIIFGLITYATKGVSFGAIEPEIPNMMIPKINGFPTIILWAVAAIIIVWFIWNKTTFGKNLYAVGGNPEAASVSGISVFWVTMFAFIMAGILYGFGSWLECMRMVGSGSAAYGQGWDMDAIAACVVGGVSFTGGIGKISGVVVGVLIFTALTYSLTILGIDTNLQFVFEGIIIISAVTLDSLKYVQKK